MVVEVTSFEALHKAIVEDANEHEIFRGVRSMEHKLIPRVGRIKWRGDLPKEEKGLIPVVSGIKRSQSNELGTSNAFKLVSPLKEYGANSSEIGTFSNGVTLRT